jgi:ATP-dependent Lhr-like helicase
VPPSALAPFHPLTRAWFEDALGEPTRAQREGWPAILRGESTLLLAPTGSGKTLAAFLASLDRLVFGPPCAKPSCRVVYVSPLKALAVDVEKNLRAPLAGLLARAAAAGAPARAPSVVVRTGDTPQVERARMRRVPPEILITTPESLYLVLTSGAREILTGVELVILDEIHSVVATKRGAHLMLSLERLEDLRRSAAGEKPLPPLQRVGLSATQRPLDEVARLLGGFHAKPTAKAAKATRHAAAADAGWAPRPVTIVDASEKKRLELTIEVPPGVTMGHLEALDAAPADDPPFLVSGPAAANTSRARGRA